MQRMQTLLLIQLPHPTKGESYLTPAHDGHIIMLIAMQRMQTLLLVHGVHEARVRSCFLHAPAWRSLLCFLLAIANELTMLAGMS
jgi:hypothetical protein